MNRRDDHGSARCRRFPDRRVSGVRGCVQHAGVPAVRRGQQFTEAADLEIADGAGADHDTLALGRDGRRGDKRRHDVNRGRITPSVGRGRARCRLTGQQPRR